MRQSLASSTAGTGELPRILLELGLEALEQRKRVRGRACETGDDAAAAAKLADLLGVVLDDGSPEAHLAVARDHHPAVLADGEYGCRMPGRLGLV